MIAYFYNKYLKYGLNPIFVKNRYFLEATPAICTNIILKDKQFFTTNLLFYSILSFYTWVRFITEQHLSLLVIIEQSDISVFKLFGLMFYNFDMISEKAWIPGLLSNSNEIWKGNRYLLNVGEEYIQLQNYPDFICLCSTKRPIISHEAKTQLIPQITMVSTIHNDIANCFIPLWIPKWKLNNKIKNLKTFSYSQHIISHFLITRHIIEKYLIIKRTLKIRAYFIYFLFFNYINFNKNI